MDLPDSGSDSDIIILTGKKEDVLKAQKKIQLIQSEQADVVGIYKQFAELVLSYVMILMILVR